MHPTKHVWKSVSRRTGLTAAALACAAVATGLIAPPQASAAITNPHDIGDISLLVSKDTHHLVMIVEHDPYQTTTDTLVTVAPGTSPAVAGSMSKTNGWIGAFQGITNELWLGGDGVAFHDTKLKMAPGTSPSVVGLDDPGAFIVAYVAPDYRIHLFQNGVDRATGANIIAGTSPAITRVTINTWEVAFHGQDNVLWLFGPDMVGHELDGGLGLAAGTSPAIAPTLYNDYGFTVAWNAQGNNDLWIAFGLTSATSDWNNHVYDTQFEMDPHSNPTLGGGNQVQPTVQWNALPPGDRLASAYVSVTSISAPAVGPQLAPGTSPCHGDSPNFLEAFEKVDNDVFAGDNNFDDTGILAAPDSSPVTATLWSAT